MLIDIEDVNNNAETSLNYLWEDENIFEEEILMDTPTVNEISITQRKEEIDEHGILEES